jgi:hypothetical protein
METLSDIVKEEVSWYAGTSGRGINLRLFKVFDETRQVYAVTASDYPKRVEPGSVIVMARIVDNRVVIEEDNTDRPLVDRLTERGIPRDQIILAYTGEPVPDPLAV